MILIQGCQLPLNVFQLFSSVDVIEFLTVEAYSCFVTTGFKYNINKLSRVLKKQVLFRIKPSILTDLKEMQSTCVWKCSLYPKVFHSVRTGYRRVTYFISSIKKSVVLLKPVTLVSLMFNFIKLGVYQPCIPLISDCSRVKFSAEFIVRKIVILANNSYLEYLITLQSSYYIKKQRPKNRFLWDPRKNVERKRKGI